MRCYNFRKQAKLKEQNRRKELWNTGYWPSMPNQGVGENGEKYYLEGRTGTYKRFLKRQANKAVRRAELGTVGSGKNYRKVFDLEWEWF